MVLGDASITDGYAPDKGETYLGNRPYCKRLVTEACSVTCLTMAEVKLPSGRR
jgi:hypothetical protein